MSLRNRLGAHPWIFVGLAVLPSSILIIILISLFVFGQHSNTAPSEIPDWLCYAAFFSLPILSAIVGFVLAYGLSSFLEARHWLAVRPLTNVYISVFTIVWNLVFSFLNFFVFAMGFGDGPAITTMKSFVQRFTGILTIGLPEAIVISLLVCSIATAIAVVLLETILPKPAKP